MAHVRRQHVLSKVLLRRFAANDRGDDRVIRYALQFGREARVPIGAVGYVVDLIEHRSADAEARWGELEKDMPRVFARLDSGTLLDDPVSVEKMKQLIALHFLRRQRTREVFDVAAEALVEDRLRAFDQRTELHAAAAESVLGRPAASRQDWDDVRDAVEAELRSVLPEALFENATGMFARAQADLMGMNLEIAVAREGEFLLVDVGVVTFGDDLRILDSPLFGEGEKFLPVGPRHAIALSSAPGTHDFHEREVAALNRLSINAARDSVYYRPGAELKDLISRTGSPVSHES